MPEQPIPAELKAYFIENRAREAALEAAVLALLTVEAARTPGFTRSASKFLDEALSRPDPHDGERIKLRALEVYQGWLSAVERDANARQFPPGPGPGFWQRLSVIWDRRK